MFYELFSEDLFFQIFITVSKKIWKIAEYTNITINNRIWKNFYNDRMII